LLTSPWLYGLASRPASRPSIDASLLRRPGEDRAHAEVDQIGGAPDPQRGEGRLGRAQERRDPDRRGDRPEALAARGARGGDDAGAAAAEQAVPNRERGVRSGHDDHECRHGEECGEMGRQPGTFQRRLQGVNSCSVY
jgi:hypothetical protein